MLPIKMTRDFFDSLGADTTSLDWNTVNRNHIAPFESFFRSLAPDLQERAGDILHDIHKLACDDGMAAINDAVEMLHHEPISLGEVKNANCYARALLTWNADKEVFEKAVSIVQLRQMAWCRKRRHLSRQTPEFTEAVQRKFEHELEKLFAAKQGRGHVCTVEMLDMGNGMYYFFAYPDDYLKSAFTHDESRTLVPQTFQHTFEIVFAYNAQWGTLEICGKVSSKVKKQLEDIFVDVILNSRIERYEETVYQLDMLKNLQFAPAVDPEDRIRVTIRELELVGKDGMKLHITAPVGKSIFQSIAKVTHEENDWYMDAKVTFVKFRFEFMATRERRYGTTTFAISLPNMNTIQCKDVERLEIIKKHLIQWGMEHEKVTYNYS
jgi:hypothetical protein